MIRKTCRGCGILVFLERGETGKLRPVFHSYRNYPGAVACYGSRIPFAGKSGWRRRQRRLQRKREETLFAEMERAEQEARERQEERTQEHREAKRFVRL